MSRQTHTGRRLLLDPDGDFVIAGGRVTDVVAAEDADEEELVDLVVSVIDASVHHLPHDVRVADDVVGARDEALRAIAIWYATVRAASTPLERQLRAGVKAGKVLPEEADVIREFASFLSDAGPHPNAEGHDPSRYAAALREYREFLTGGTT